MRSTTPRRGGSKPKLPMETPYFGCAFGMMETALTRKFLVRVAVPNTGVCQDARACQTHRRRTECLESARSRPRSN